MKFLTTLILVCLAFLTVHVAGWKSAFYYQYHADDKSVASTQVYCVQRKGSVPGGSYRPWRNGIASGYIYYKQSGSSNSKKCEDRKACKTMWLTPYDNLFRCDRQFSSVPSWPGSR